MTSRRIKKSFIIAVALLIVAAVTLFVAKPQSSTNKNLDSSDSRRNNLPIVTAHIKNKEFHLYAPESEIDRQTGLAAFDSLPHDEGMIFRCLPPSELGIWMKNMKFDIDVIWLDETNAITHLERKISKDSYPTQYKNPTSAPSTYLIELPKGSVDDLSLKIGDIVSYQ